MARESTQPLTEMSTRNLPGGKGWQVREADNLTAIPRGYAKTSQGVRKIKTNIYIYYNIFVI
jgi:hypothetical protein